MLLEGAYLFHFVAQQKLLISANDHFDICSHRSFRFFVVRIYLHLLLDMRLC